MNIENQIHLAMNFDFNAYEQEIETRRLIIQAIIRLFGRTAKKHRKCIDNARVIIKTFALVLLFVYLSPQFRARYPYIKQRMYCNQGTTIENYKLKTINYNGKINSVQSI